MYQVIIVIHVLLGLGIIGLIMIQQGKGADAGASFGTGSSASVFGAQGAGSFLSRTTAIFAALFFTTSLGLAILGGKQGQASDVMSAPATEKQDNIALPPIVETKPEAAVPVAPVAAPQAPASPPAIVEEEKPVDVPKAEAVKPVEATDKQDAGTVKEAPKK